MPTARDYQAALDDFLNNEEAFAQAVIESGALQAHGGFFSIELFRDGTYQLRNENDRSDVTGRVIGVPSLSDEDYRELCHLAGTSDQKALVTAMLADGWPLGGIRDTMQRALDATDEPLDY